MQKNSGLLVVGFLLLTHCAFSQNTDSTAALQSDSIKSTSYFSGSISVTNNGISIVPSFSLEKPAAIFNLAMGKNRFSFEPDIRFSLAGRPWSFLFWGRYKAVTTDRFNMNIGTHLGLNFKTTILPINGDTSATTVTRRYIAGELFPRYTVAKNVIVGVYYLYSHGLDAGTIDNAHYVTLNTNFSNIGITDKFFIKFNPQFYYLKLDAQDGFYFTSSLTMAKKDLPFTISGIINKKISSNITGSKDLLWNVSMAYVFNKKQVQLQRVL